MRRFFVPIAADSLDTAALKRPRMGTPAMTNLTTSIDNTSVHVIDNRDINASAPSSETTINITENWVAAIPPYETILSEQDLRLASQKDNHFSVWQHHDGLLFRFRTNHSETFRKVIALDLDHTIIVPRSNRRFPVDGDDWRFWSSEVPRKLSMLAEDGHGIVFLSNQQSLGKKAQENVAEFTRKVDAVIDAIGIPIDFLCATEENRFRKPLTGMWEFYQAARGTPSMEVAFIGDAAGRPVHGTRSKDFSDSDIKFARNLNIPFFTPERFFLRSKQRIHIHFPPVLASPRLVDHVQDSNNVVTSLVDAASTTIEISSCSADEEDGRENDNVTYDDPIPRSLLGKQEIVVLVGAPASGKSTLALKLEQHFGFVRVNRDEMGTLEKCLQVAKEAVKDGKSVVVDNTNLNAATRMTWVRFAKECHKRYDSDDVGGGPDFPIAVRAIVLDVPKDVTMQLARYRIADPKTRKEDRRVIPTMAVHTFFKNRETPTIKEGFDRVDTIPWKAQLPSHAVGQRLFRMYLS